MQKLIGATYFSIIISTFLFGYDVVFGVDMSCTLIFSPIIFIAFIWVITAIICWIINV